MKTILHFLITLALALTFASCGSDGSDSDVIGDDNTEQKQLYLQSDEHAAQVGESFVRANTRFAAKLFKEMNEQEETGNNIFISPYSVSAALAMTYNGATGETKEAMAQTLEYQGIALETLNQDYQHLIASLENVDEEVILAIANSIWMDDQFAPEVKEAFLEVMTEIFSSELFSIDLEGPDAVSQINGWIEDNTNGKIKEMLTEIPAGVVMYLINALYFKANWKYEFDPEDTVPRDFKLADGFTKRADMMTAASPTTEWMRETAATAATARIGGTSTNAISIVRRGTADASKVRKKIAPKSRRVTVLPRGRSLSAPVMIMAARIARSTKP